MPVYLQLILLFIGGVVFYVLLLYVTGLGIRKYCLRIIAEMEDQKAFSASSALNLQEERGNFFRLGLANYRPKALNVLVVDKIVVKTSNGKYYLNKEKLADIKSQLK